MRYAARMHRLLLIALSLTAAAAVASACGSPEERVNRQGFDIFKAAVASDRNYDVYWLGRDPEVLGSAYAGPAALARSDPGGQVEGGGLVTFYGQDPSWLEIDMYSLDGWDRITASRPKSVRYESKSLTIDNHPAELLTRHNEGGDVQSRRLVVHFERTVVEATTGAVVPSTPTAPQPNPLTDEATFLAVMQNLRPYPE